MLPYPEAPLSRKRILLVEDEPLILLILADIFASEGFDIAEAGSGDAASLLLDGPDPFDLVITDIQMPGTRDGIAVAQHAKARHPGIPIVYVTGRPDNIARITPLNEREAFVRKPYGPDEVVAVARRLLATS